LRSGDREAVPARRRDREHDRERTDEQGPLIHLRAHERPEGEAGLQAPREQAGDHELGRLGRERGEPLDQEELRDPEVVARLHQGVRERLGAEDDHRRGPDRERGDRDPARDRRQ
jgi:hypothetical protein